MAQALDSGNPGDRIPVRLADGTVENLICGNTVNTGEVQVHGDYVFGKAPPMIQTRDRDIFRKGQVLKPSCLQPCQVVPISIWSLNRGANPDFDYPPGVYGLVYEPEFISYRFDIEAGICEVVTDGSGEYTDGATCVAENTQPIPTYNTGVDDSDVAFGSPQAPAQDEGDFDPDLNSFVDSSDIDEMYFNAPGGALSIDQPNGIISDNDFSFRTQLTGNLADGILASITWRKPGPPDELRTFSISLEAFVNGAGNTDVIIFGTGTLSPTSQVRMGNSYFFTYPSIDFTTLTTTSSFSFRTIIRQDLLDTKPDDDWEFDSANFDLGSSIVLTRNVFVLPAGARTQFSYGIKFHDPDLPLISLIPLFGREEVDNARHYSFYNGKTLYLYTKIGKERNPNIPFESRHWQRIIVSEIDISTGSALITQTNYDFPTLPPIIDGNPIAEKTNSFFDPPFENNCLNEVDPNTGMFLVKPNAQAIDPEVRAVYQAESLQIRCTGDLLEFYAPGSLIFTG